MKERIIQNITRLNLHDSHIEKIQRSNDKLILVIDWAKLENYFENEIKERIILGKCILSFDGFSDETLKLDFSGIPGKENNEAREIHFNPELFKDWLILENKTISSNKYSISGLIDFEDAPAWLDWTFLYSNFKLTWDDSITWKDWKNGKLIIE